MEITVKELMVPLEEYATVSEEATLFDAVMALEEAQENLDRTRYKYLHRAILVLDKDRNVVGKISQLDVLRALEPKYKDGVDTGSLSRGGLSPELLKSMVDGRDLWAQPLQDICARAARVRIKSFMHTPGEGEYVDGNAPLQEAIHTLMMGHHHSLLVTEGKKIVGILRLTDVFVAIFDVIQACPI